MPQELFKLEKFGRLHLVFYKAGITHRWQRKIMAKASPMDPDA